MASETYKPIPLQLTIHTPWGSVVLDQERYVCMPDLDTVIIVAV